MNMIKLRAVAVLTVLIFAAGVSAGIFYKPIWSWTSPIRAKVTETAREFGLIAQELPEMPETRAVSSILRSFDLTVVNPKSGIQGAGGGLGVTPELVLIARDPDGKLLAYNRATQSISATGIQLPPINWRAVPKQSPMGRDVDLSYIRYNGIHYWTWQGEEYLATSHHYFNAANQCFTVRFSRARLPVGWAAASEVVLDWEQLLETQPCMPLNETGRNIFGGNQAGGRIDNDAQGNIYLTIGDFEYDGYNEYRAPWPQRDDNNYGKIYRFSPDGAIKLYSKGHRNPQGIVVVPDGRIWSVEHGPQGGDELNLVRADMDYGWPSVTLGVEYGDLTNGDRVWPNNPKQGGHGGSEMPIFAWLPSIAPSGIAYVTGPSRWEGDLLVSTLGHQKLHHLRLEGSRVVYDEPIHIGSRIRDVAVSASEIFMLYDDGRFAVMRDRGKQAQPEKSAAQ